MQESWGKRKGPNMGRPGSRTAREESLMRMRQQQGQLFRVQPHLAPAPAPIPTPAHARPEPRFPRIQAG